MSRTPAELITKLLKDAGISQTALAAATGYHPRHVNRVCNGHKVPSAEFVVAVSWVLGVMPYSIWLAVANHQLDQALSRMSESRDKQLKVLR